jgi:hypothetical protein
LRNTWRKKLARPACSIACEPEDALVYSLPTLRIPRWEEAVENEQIKTEVVKQADNLAELALQGRLQSAKVAEITPEGSGITLRSVTSHQ